MPEKRVKFSTAAAPRLRPYVTESPLPGSGGSPEAGEDWSGSAVTRYFCAAAHLKFLFRNRVLGEYLGQRHRAIVASDGVDMGLVLAHCLDSKARANRRDLYLCAVVLVCLLLAVLLGVDYLPVVVAVYGILAWVILFSAGWAEYRLIINNFLKANYNPYCIPEPRDPTKKQTIESVSAAQNNRAVVYSGFSPFVGAGIELGGWSFAVDTNRGCQGIGGDEASRPFQVREVYTALDRCVASLALNADVEDRIFVHGSDVGGDPRLLPDPMDRPRVITDPAVVESYVDATSNIVRHYKQIRLMAWDGELILSLFIRVTKPGRDLFVETNYLLLTPLGKEFHALDKINPKRAWRRSLGMAATAVPMVVFWPLAALQLLEGFGLWLQRREIRAAIREDATFDRGAATSIREQFSSPNYERYFQKLDQEMYRKILEKHILDTIVDFLDAHRVDTSELKQRQQFIMNAGVMVSGGGSVFNMGAMSVGEGSRAAAVAQAAGGKH